MSDHTHKPDSNSLQALDIKPLTGNESFQLNGQLLPLNVLSFWRWSSSNLAANNLRGYLAEFLVAADFGALSGSRVEWDACDLRVAPNLRIEVKSSAYLQSWKQRKLSTINFDISPTYGWDSETETTSNTYARNSDAYVFCLLAHQNKGTLNPLNLDQWEFYVLPTKTIDLKLGNQKTLSLNGLLKLHPIKCQYGQISKTIRSLLTDS